MSRVIALGGRYFAAAEQTSARQDGWVMVHVAEAGLDRLGGQELAEDTAREVVLQALRSEKMWHLLAGVLVESGQRWAPESAEQNAAFFADLTDPESKRVMFDQFVGFLAGFFWHAPAASPPSLSASVETMPPSRRPRKRGVRSTTRSAPEPAATGASAPGNSLTATLGEPT